ncbi:MAG: polyprenyl synthetase family protein [bacterium]
MKSSEQKFIEFYEKERKTLDGKFKKIFKGKSPASLYEPSAYLIENGGKRLRPLLVLLSCMAAGGDKNKAVNAAIAVEILHNFTLVHDDIMDNAPKRRGLPTLHNKYDLSTAILAGDNLIAFAYQYLLKDCLDNDKQVIATFTKGIVEICEGQSLDKEFESKKNVTIEEYLLMIKKKTAALAEICCSIGAQIAKGNKKDIDNLSKFGLYLGLAFQIQDDLLDIFGNENEFGKTVGGDLIEGKKTYLFIKALEHAKGKDKQKLEAVIKNKGILQEEVQSYKDIYIKLGVIDEANAEIIKYTTKALNSIKSLKNTEAIELLNNLANSLIKRNK